MSGTINLAFTQQFDMDGVPLSGGLLYFFTAGTTTPQSAFQDTGLTIAHPNPIVLDASGRVPMFYLADGFIKIRLTDDSGVTVIAADQLLVIGPSSGGGGGGGSTPGDTTQFLATGDIKARYDTGVKDGFVRCNGNTIGNVGSSATERAEAVCQPLFVHLWSFPNILLDGFAKGANALSDFNAGRRLILPDLRGRTIAGMDDMGAAAANRLTSTFFGASGIVLGNSGGLESRAPLTLTDLPRFTPAGTVSQPSGSASGGSASLTALGVTYNEATVSSFGNFALSGGPTAPAVTGINGAGSPATATLQSSSISVSQPAITVSQPTFTGTPIGNLTPPSSKGVQPTMVLTWYMKL
jgi:hypothetical protein